MDHLFDRANPMMTMNVRSDSDDDVIADDDDGDNSTRVTTCSILNTPQQHQRRLTNAKVREIFECLYYTVGIAAPPPKIPLPFTIVPVNSNGKALSPPSYEFEYGLYILLRPAKGSKSKNQHEEHPLPPLTQVPEHLQHLVMTEYPPETCKWQLSGPQFPTPTAIQQRYCYPQGREEYSQCTGSALWTMYNMDGIENKEFRLLHVYYSTKRLHNGGARNGKSSLDTIDVSDHHINLAVDNCSVFTSISESTKSPSKQRKSPKRHKTTKMYDSSQCQNPRQVAQVQPSPSLSTTTTTALAPPLPARNSFSRPPQQKQQPHYRYLPKSSIPGNFPPISPIRYFPPTSYPHTTTGTNGYTVSPPSPWPEASATTSSTSGGSSTSQAHNYTYRPQQPFQRYYDRSMLVMESNGEEHLRQNHDPSEYSYHDHSPITNGPSQAPQILPFRRHYHPLPHHHYNHHHFDDNEQTVVVPTNPNETTSDDTIRSSSTDETFPKFTNNFDHHNDDLQSIIMTPIHVGNEDDAATDDNDSVSLWEEVSEDKTTEYDNDPFTRMTRRPLRPQKAVTVNHSNPTHASKGHDMCHKNGGLEIDNTTDSNHLQTSLELVHVTLRDCIHQAPSHDQAELVQLLSSWARQLADDPLVLLASNITATTAAESTKTAYHNALSSHPVDDGTVPGTTILATKSHVDQDPNDKGCKATNNENEDDVLAAHINLESFVTE